MDLDEYSFLPCARKGSSLFRKCARHLNMQRLSPCFTPSQLSPSRFLFQLVTLQEAKLLLNEDDYLIKAVYDYWVRKRKNCRGPSLIPQIKQEKRDGSTNNDPYVAFRRRTEKMQTRKVTCHFQSYMARSHFDFFPAESVRCYLQLLIQLFVCINSCNIGGPTSVSNLLNDVVSL